MNIFESWEKQMCHFLKCVKHLFAFSFTIIPRDKIKNNVPKFCYSCAANCRKVCILHSIHQTGSFSRVRKKRCSPYTLSNIFSEQNIRMSQGLVTSEASVLCFLCIYSFPVFESLLILAETSSADESIRSWKPVFQEIEWNEVKSKSNMQIWCSNPSSW